MESASVILASFAGSVLCYRAISYIKNAHNLKTYVKQFGVLEVFLLAIIVLWGIAIWYMLHSGRAEYCASFELKRGLAYMQTTLSSTRGGFRALFAIVFVASFVAAFFGRTKQHRFLILILNLWFVCLVVFYTLTTSRCGATWYLMSGLLMSGLVLMIVHISIFVAHYRASYVCVSLVFFIALLQSLQPYKERPRSSYMYLKPYSQSWIDQVQNAQNEDKTQIDIFVPDSFPHHHWNTWFAPSFPRTLKNYGVIQKDIKVLFKPLSQKMQ